MKWLLMVMALTLVSCTDKVSIFIEAETQCTEKCEKAGMKWEGLLRSSKKEFQCLCEVPVRSE
jgi:hypothetical protein